MVLQDIRTCPTYVINLDRRPDRWKEFSTQPALKKFTQLQRFSAVDGKTLELFKDDRISLHTRENIKANYRRSHYEINTAGAIGASFSHITIWQNFLKGDAEYLVVFEDDTIVNKDYLSIVDKLIPTLPEGQWDMWLLGTHRWGLDGKPLVKGSLKHWWNVSSFTGAHAYVLSRKGAAILLENPYPIETHIEYYICNCAKFKGLKLIKHWALRMTYFAETTEIADSDTFLNRTTCPLCAIPDEPIYYGLYITYDQMAVLLAVALATVGVWSGLRR
jgi:GR25 family glycosyltransferase involved in LPS biosynthesis